MVQPILDLFDIQPDYNFQIMKPNQTLNDIAFEIFKNLKPVLLDFKPTHVFVQGDTASAAVAGMMSFFEKIQVVHIEAGLRTYDLNSPWPEEFNRRLIALTASWHFTPTILATTHLINEGVNSNFIFMVGNTGIDALRIASEMFNVKVSQLDTKKEINPQFQILVTLHRRESFGKEMRSIMRALKEIILSHPEVELIWPLHQNPQVRSAFHEIFDFQTQQIKVLEPLGYNEFIQAMNFCDLIVTDSGGVQEEAPFLGKPVLVCRNNTERQEAIDCGSALLVGTDQENIKKHILTLLPKTEKYQNMSIKRNPFGDGYASEKIINCIMQST